MSSGSHDLSLLNTPSKKRARESEGESRFSKRRRSSISLGLVLRTELASTAEEIEDDSIQTNSSCDRFLPTLSNSTMPLYGPDTTSRLARALGLFQPRVLSFRDDTPSPLFAHHLSDPTLPMRTPLARSLAGEGIHSASTHSAAKHGNIKPEKVLDSGHLDDFPLHPCAWSRKDVLAAVIRERVFMHDMEEGKVSNISVCARATSVEWTSDTKLAVGCDRGEMILIDAQRGACFQVYVPQDFHLTSFTLNAFLPNKHYVSTVSWNPEQRVLAAGRETGEVTYIDPRLPNAIRIDAGPANRFVTNVKWSPDGLFLASGHKGGMVRCMDWRANKAFELRMPHDNKAHRFIVRSLAWAPWNPRLLATGGGTHDHTVRIWSISRSQNSSYSGPLHTLPFSSSISSLHFSPHTTELLSTHGGQAIASVPPRSMSKRSRTRSTPKLPETRHGILVHTYPSLERVHTVTDAHAGPIVDSVLAPDGTQIMTFGEDETLRQWVVWGCSRRRERALDMTDRLSIR